MRLFRNTLECVDHYIEEYWPWSWFLLFLWLPICWILVIGASIEDIIENKKSNHQK